MVVAFMIICKWCFTLLLSLNEIDASLQKLSIRNQKCTNVDDDTDMILFTEGRRDLPQEGGGGQFVRTFLENSCTISHEKQLEPRVATHISRATYSHLWFSCYL